MITRLYDILRMEDNSWHAHKIGWVCSRDEGFVARFSTGHISAGGVPMEKTMHADTVEDLLTQVAADLGSNGLIFANIH